MPPNKLRYRKYKSFHKVRILKNVSNLPEKTNYTEWENQFLRVLNKNAPLKSKVIRGNNKPFVIITLGIPITQRSALKKKANTLNNSLSITNYKLRNFVVNLSRKFKKYYFQKHMSHSSPSKTFGNFANLSLLIK